MLTRRACAQGYATLERLRATSDACERARIEADAAGPLFRAAAGLGPGGGAAELPGPSSPNQAPAQLGGAGSLVRGLLRELLADMTGAYQDEGPQVLLPLFPTHLP